MGTLFSKLDDKMPEVYSYSDYERVVTQVNEISIQISKETFLILNVSLDSLQLNYGNWKNSLIKANLGLFPILNLKKQPIQKEEQRDNEPYFLLVLSMRQLYNIFELLKYFKKPKIGERSSLTKTPSFDQGKGCQICFDQTADLALPCGHIFGAKCISKYIIDKQLKTCPMCRREFIGRRSAFQKDLYIVIDEDESIFNQVRSCLLDALKDKNAQAIKSATAILKQKNTAKK